MWSDLRRKSTGNTKLAPTSCAEATAKDAAACETKRQAVQAVDATCFQTKEQIYLWQNF